MAVEFEPKFSEEAERVDVIGGGETVGFLEFEVIVTVGHDRFG